jgi:superfamily II DNA or RNA helicase
VSEYHDFISSKRIKVPDCGFEPMPHVAPLFPFQARAVDWSIRKGRAALFLDTGLGKTRCQLEWARQVQVHTGKPVIVLAPLAVAQQTVREAASVGIRGVHYAKDASDIRGQVVVTNYERLGKFDASIFGGVVLDESGILKSYTGTTKRAIFAAFKATPYKLACSATPAPNDHLELGNHAEFLDVMSSHQMIARWFITDLGTFGTYRLKGHAVEDFWDWVSSWAVMASKPSDLGPFDDERYNLPLLYVRRHVVEVDQDSIDADKGTLFRLVEMNATSVHKERRRTAVQRAGRLAEIVATESDEPWLIWCETDYEADAVMSALNGVIEVSEVKGSHSAKAKEETLTAFSDGSVRCLLTKPKIAGFGMNWQHCARVAFCGATYSFESFYQAIRRVWRFGQVRPVEVHVVMGSTESRVWAVLERKRSEFEVMKRSMLAAAVRNQQKQAKPGDYMPATSMEVPAWMS